MKEAIRAEGKIYCKLQVDGYRHYPALVIISMFANQVDPARSKRFYFHFNNPFRLSSLQTLSLIILSYFITFLHPERYVKIANSDSD